MDYKEKVITLLKSQELSKEQKEKLEEIFPELKESEDEKMRKWIINYLNNKALNSSIMQEKTNIKNAIAWLEKQGEQKPVFEMKTPNESLGIDSDTYNKIVDECIYDEQKPAWSEEDETTKNNISHIIRQYDKISKKEKQPCWYVGDCLLWMQNIKDRVQPQPKQEWSEEDDYNLQCMIAKVASDIQKGNVGRNNELIDWLKSLRPQSQWKPSEEMLEALDRVIPENVMEISEDEMLLNKLYQGLKYGRVLSKN